VRISFFLISVLFAFQTFACQLKAGVREFPPYSYQINNQWQGFDIQVLTQLVLSVNCQISFVEAPFGEALKMLRSGNIDLLMHLSISGDRGKDINFVGPIRTQNISLLTSKKVSSPISNIEEIIELPYTFGHRQGIFIGNEFDEKRQNISSFASKFVEVNQASNLIRLVQRHRIDGFFEDHHYNEYLLANDPAANIMIVQPLKFSIGEVYLGVSKKSVSAFHTRALQKALNNILLPY
jgi:polar amino acid transport system substrate-binding protein